MWSNRFNGVLALRLSLRQRRCRAGQQNAWRLVWQAIGKIVGCTDNCWRRDAVFALSAISGRHHMCPARYDDVQAGTKSFYALDIKCVSTLKFQATSSDIQRGQAACMGNGLLERAGVPASISHESLNGCSIRVGRGPLLSIAFSLCG